MSEIYLLIVVILIVMYWFDSISARDFAIEAGHQLTKRTQLQLLDETVACSRVRLGRNQYGRVQIQRTYEFEVSANGADRMTCQLTLLGRELQSWHIPPYLQAVH